jgi:hypothetical protein
MCWHFSLLLAAAGGEQKREKEFLREKTIHVNLRAMVRVGSRRQGQALSLRQIPPLFSLSKWYWGVPQTPAGRTLPHRREQEKTSGLCGNGVPEAGASPAATRRGCSQAQIGAAKALPLPSVFHRFLIKFAPMGPCPPFAGVVPP